MTIRIFYHITCIGSWESILNSQINKIIYSGLYGECENIYCYILGVGNTEDFKRCIWLLQNIGNKIIIQKTNETEQLNESFTLSDIKNGVDEDTQILYLHTKGVTRYGTTLYKFDDEEYIINNLYENIMDWNNVMEYVLIKNYKSCVDQLQICDVVGINYMDNPSHFSGNFWWCTGKYYLSLQLETGICESYICSNDPIIEVMFDTGLAGFGHYFNEYKMINYLDTLKFEL